MRRLPPACRRAGGASAARPVATRGRRPPATPRRRLRVRSGPRPAPDAWVDRRASWRSRVSCGPRSSPRGCAGRPCGCRSRRLRGPVLAVLSWTVLSGRPDGTDDHGDRRGAAIRPVAAIAASAMVRTRRSVRRRCRARPAGAERRRPAIVAAGRSVRARSAAPGPTAAASAPRAPEAAIVWRRRHQPGSGSIARLARSAAGSRDSRANMSRYFRSMIGQA